MKIKIHRLRIMGAVIGSLLMMVLANTANAGPILCETLTNNHMFVDSSQVTACVDAGLGNINQNPATDDFLTSGGTAAGYVGAGVTSSFTTGGTEFGTWSIASAVDAIGFKFGTGNTPDEWFIYDLVANVTSGNWAFIDVLAPGLGGSRLSHMETYNKGPTIVSAPVTVAFLGIGLLGLSFARRRRT